MGANISKLYSSLKSVLNPLQLFLNFLLGGLHKSSFEFLKFDFIIFNELLNFTVVPYWESKNLLSGNLATVERNGLKFGPGGEYSVYTGCF